MPRLPQSLDRYRLALLAVALSAAVHAAVFMGMPRRIAAIEEKTAATYSAILEAATPAPSVPAPTAMPAPTAAPRPPPRRAKPTPAVMVAAPAYIAIPAESTAPPAETALSAAPDIIALAPPTSPPPAPMPESFPVAALPDSLSISYQITSAFADGRATYSWEREGDNYRITGEAEAEGFFTLFLEGQIQQESRGTVTGEGLRPERFVERRPNNVREGLEFDWLGRQVTFSRAGNSNTSALTDNTVDWLSMIFQMAHLPPQGESMKMQVFTQRRMYRFTLQVLGYEEIEIPLGKVRALHLRHADPNDAREVVDVWLGVDHHHLPVKLRFPVARNRLMVEQVATRVSTR